MIFTNKQSAVAEIALLLVKRSQDYDHAVISPQVRATSANENSAKVTSTQCSDVDLASSMPDKTLKIKKRV